MSSEPVTFNCEAGKRQEHVAHDASELIMQASIRVKARIACRFKQLKQEDQGWQSLQISMSRAKAASFTDNPLPPRHTAL
eukprot:1159720-Pelagomonas_calceolata.AAC.5